MTPTPSDCCVLLLHGLIRTHRSMRVMQRELSEAGYLVANIDYPSRHYPVKDLAQIALEQGLQAFQQSGAEHLHIVTHSLGGILVRQYAAEHAIPSLHRVVMLAPPNRGSEVVDRLRYFPGYYLLHGPAGRELGTRTSDLPQQLGPVSFELGVIAGRRSVNLVLSSMIPGVNDGKVSLRNTMVAGMQDFITLPVTHTFMMRNRKVITQTQHFLQHGSFAHGKGELNPLQRN